MTCDREINEIMDIIKTDPFYKDNTYLIVSPDHDRNTYYMQHNLYNNKPVWLYIYGPDIKKGTVIFVTVIVKLEYGIVRLKYWIELNLYIFALFFYANNH